MIAIQIQPAFNPGSRYLYVPGAKKSGDTKVLSSLSPQHRILELSFHLMVRRDSFNLPTTLS
jgi:hypothetical protein